MNDQIQRAVLTFVAVLRDSWTHVRDLVGGVCGQDPDCFLSDWAQATWEMLVEASVWRDGEVYLEPYGEGADCNDVGSRVWRPGVVSTHGVHCIPVNGNSLRDVLTGETFKVADTGYALEQFVTATEDGWYRVNPPFDHVLLYRDGRDTVVRLEDVRFTLVRIS